jgi:hypothetical protein
MIMQLLGALEMVPGFTPILTTGLPRAASASAQISVP